jgi:hypothetical protein
MRFVGASGEKAFVVRLTFTPKIRTSTAAFIRQHIALVEVPRDLVHRRQSESINQNLREKTIALNLARQAALATFSAGAEQVAWPWDEDALWYEDRPYVMDERPSDHEENGVQVWKIVLSTG